MRIFVGETLAELDLNEGVTISVNITADSLESLDTVQNSFTREIEIPLTLFNRSLLGELQADDANAQKYNDIIASVQDDKGAEVLERGVLNIERVEGRNAYGNIFKGIINIFDQLEGLTLQDIPINSFGTPAFRNEGNVTANIDNVYTDGFTYATFNNGNYAGGAFAVEQLYPFPFVWQILKNIFALTTYTLNDSVGLMADASFQTWVLPYSGTRYNPTAQFYDSINQQTVTAGTGYNQLDSSQAAQGTTPLSSEAFDPATGFTVPDGNKAYFFEFRLDATAIVTTVDYTLRIQNVTQATTLASTSATGAGLGIDVTIQTGLIDTLNTGDVIIAEIDVTAGNSIVTGPNCYFRNDDGTRTAGTNLYQNPPSPYVFDSVTLLPDMPCIDFVKAILQMTMSRVDLDVVENTVSFRKFETYARDPNRLNLSEKIDESEEIEKDFVYGDYSQVNKFVYSNDDNIPEQRGSAQILINNKNLDPEPKELIELPFSASESSIFGLSIPICESGSDDIVNELTPRIAAVESNAGTVTVGATNKTPYNELKFGRLDWNNLLVDYYPTLIKTIQRMQKVKVKVRLDAVDFAQLDLFQPVEIAYSNSFCTINGFFFLQNVEDYTGEGSAMLELIKLDLIE